MPLMDSTHSSPQGSKLLWLKEKSNKKRKTNSPHDEWLQTREPTKQAHMCDKRGKDQNQTASYVVEGMIIAGVNQHHTSGHSMPSLMYDAK